MTTALPQTEPCIHATKLPDIDKRGSECSSVNLKNQLCDRQFTTGWYKGVDNKVYYDMPTYCVDVAACGTNEPIWLNGNDVVKCIKSSVRRSQLKKKHLIIVNTLQWHP